MSAASTTPKVEPDALARWQASLSLDFVQREGRTVLARRRHEGPLMVQRPFTSARGDCHVYLIHPPGGVAGGDELKFQAELGVGTAVLFTTPAATKFYRALPGRSARVAQHISVRAAALEWLPQENIFFRGACVSSRTRIDLDSSSRFIGWEINCYGRPACDEPFDSGTLRLALELWLDGKPLLLDMQRHDGSLAARTAPWTLAGHAAAGCLLAYPCTPALVDKLRKTLVDRPRTSLSLVDGVLCCRVLADQGEEVRFLLEGLWQRLRETLMSRCANAPRIWST